MRVLAIAALALVFAMPAKAQLTDNGYANIDWQFNFPLSNHFADKASGWGMSFEVVTTSLQTLLSVLSWLIIAITNTSDVKHFR